MLPVTGSVGAIAIETDDQVAWIDVRDKGAGIPAQEQAYLFQKYFRASDHRRRPGTGLGLHISREVARQHGGNVELVRSDVNASVFRLSLPLARRDA